MSMHAPSRVPAPRPEETTGLQLSDEERDKLQEIHELINLTMKELPVMAQITAQPYTIPSMPGVPYTYSLFQLPWSGLPYVAPRVI